MTNDAHVGRRRRRLAYRRDVAITADGPNAAINVTPLVDVCLVLLIIFMVITPMLGRGKEVRLPILVDPTEHKEGDQVFVSVAQAGVWVDQDPYTSRGDFVTAVEERLKTAAGKQSAAEGGSPVLFLKADVDVSWGKARVVMEWINEADLQDIALVVEIKEG